jgi:hypothetical protein
MWLGMVRCRSKRSGGKAVGNTDTHVMTTVADCLTMAITKTASWSKSKPLGFGTESLQAAFFGLGR